MRKIDPEKHEAKRRQILDAALTCFARKGFHGTSINDICVEAGMSQGNLFHYFPNKSALINAIAEADRKEMAERFAQMAEQDDVIGAIEALALELMELSLDPIYARVSLEIMAEAMSDSEVGRLYTENDRRIKDDLVTLLIYGISKGQIDPELQPETAATWLVALADGAVSRAHIDPDFSVRSHAPMLMRLIRRFLKSSDG